MLANSKSNSNQMFELHKVYSQYLYPNDYSKIEKPIDLREHPLYLKFTPTLLPFFVKNEAITSCSTVKVHRQIADNLLKLQNSLKLLSKSGKTCISTIIGDYSFSKGYINFEVINESNMKDVKNTLFSYLDTRNIKDFKEFLSFFLLFCQDYTKNGTITSLSTFLKKATVYNTGLSIDFQKSDHNDDDIKYLQFVKNDSFDDYTRICGEFGFFVNKNAPWNIVANIASEKLNIKTKDLFQANQELLTYSFNRFRTFLFGSFDEYVVSRKFFVNKGCTGKNRKQEMDDQKLEMSEKDLLKLYLNVLSLEQSVNFDSLPETKSTFNLLDAAWHLTLDSWVGSVLPLPRDSNHISNSPNIFS